MLDELENIGPVLGFWLLVCLVVWKGPGWFGAEGYSWTMSLIISVVMLPLTYVIINQIANR